VTDTILVLAHTEDRGAASVAGWLERELGSRHVRIIRPEALSLGQWSHRVDANGHASTRVSLPKAKPLASADVGAVLNRIRYLPAPRFHGASVKDREYASVELQAVVASWLAELGDRVVHAVRRQPVVTPSLPLQHWAVAAAACGLPVARRVIASSPRARVASAPGRPDCSIDGGRRGAAPARHGGADPFEGVLYGKVLVAGDDAGGALSDHCGQSAVETSRRLGFPLLEFQFAVAEGDTVLVDVTPLPELFEPWAAAMAGRLLQAIAERSGRDPDLRPAR
jgi:hypothetical protein